MNIMLAKLKGGNFCKYVESDVLANIILVIQQGNVNMFEVTFNMLCISINV